MSTVEQRIASGMGLRVPAAKGATVKGMRPAEIILISNVSKCRSGMDLGNCAVRMSNDSCRV